MWFSGQQAAVFCKSMPNSDMAKAVPITFPYGKAVSNSCIIMKLLEYKRNSSFKIG